MPRAKDYSERRDTNFKVKISFLNEILRIAGECQVFAKSRQSINLSASTKEGLTFGSAAGNV